MLSSHGWANRRPLLLVLGVILAFAGCSSPNEAPEVTITAPNETDVHGAEVSFEASAEDPDGEVTSHRWAFGDGTTSTETSPTHTYDQAGEYRVELTVTDDADATATDGITIRVQVGPQARASIHDPDNANDVLLQYMSGRAPLSVAFDGSRSSATPGGELSAYEWDFGDGGSGTGVRTSHTYTDAGRHQATLTVTDSTGQTDAAQVVVEVSPNEAAEGRVQVGDATVAYEQAGPETSRNSTRGTSLFFKYIAETPRALTAEEIETVLRDILELIQGDRNADWINVQLYTAIRESFMAPRDYAHYLGTLTWDGSVTDGDPVTVNANTAYLNGNATRVLGANVDVEELTSTDPPCGELCGQFRMALARLYIQDEPICRQRVVDTVRDLAEWQLASRYQGYLVAMYSRDISAPIGHALGARPENGPALDEIPLALFETPPARWDRQSETIWLQLSSDIPDC